LHSQILYLMFIIAVVSRATSASAELQGFTTHDSWFDSVGGASNVMTIDFNEFPVNTTVTDHYQNLGVTFSGLNFITPTEVDPDGGYLRIFNGNDIFFNEPITYFGADIIGIVQYELYLGDTFVAESQPFGVPLDEHFGGIVSDVPFDRVHVSDPNDSLAIFWDMHFGPPIPAPGALAPLMALLLSRRSRRRLRLD